MLSIHSCVCWQSVYHLWRNVYLGLCPFLDWVVCFFDIELHELLLILEINPLSVDSFETILSHSKGCLFILFMVSFVVQELLSFIRSHLFFCFCFCFHFLRKWVQKDLAVIYVTECSVYIFL